MFRGLASPMRLLQCMPVPDLLVTHATQLAYAKPSMHPVFETTHAITHKTTHTVEYVTK